MRENHRGILFLACLALACACGGGVQPGPRTIEPLPRAALLTPSTFDGEVRRFHSLSFRDPDRRPLRERLVAYLMEGMSEELARDAYDDVVETLGETLDLYTPQEIGRGEIPRSLETPARYLIEKGSPQGDPARVLSALLILHLLRPDDAEVADYYRRLKRWSLDTQSDVLGEPPERYQGPLQTWEEHARLVPAPEVLDSLARLYLERCRALVEYYRSNERRFLAEIGAARSVQKTSLMVAAVFLREGDIASALTHVESIRSTANVEEELIQILKLALQGGETGTGAVLDLATAYLKAGRPRVALALCRDGLRTNRNDARFPQCLGRIAATENDYAAAAAWYAKAIEMMPDSRPLYDETLTTLNDLIEQDRYDPDPTVVRGLARRAKEVMAERIRRWPGSTPLVKPEALYLLIATAEMNAGNAEEAEKQLNRSVEERESIEALLQLGLLFERTDRAKQAEKTYRRALSLVEGESVGGAVQRAEIVERIGDALRVFGDQAQAAENYRQALEIWNQVLPGLEGVHFGLAQVRRGILLDRLGEKAEAHKAFALAMEYAPESRETYASILSYLVVAAPDLDLGYRAYERAFLQLSLDPEWKVYFSLWVRAIEARAGKSRATDIDGVLGSLVKQNEWWSQLARFGLGELDYQGLLERASNIGERAEAYFYQAIRRLEQGDAAGAHELLRQVLQTRMVNFYEFVMAQEILQAAGSDAVAAKR
jgi:tetratricopeptide (TPR) repeat protein